MIDPRWCTAEHWNRIGPGPHKGVALPLSAIHTQWSGGIGEFGDLIPLVHYLREVGMGILQLLPLNESGIDPSPYNALSSCALNPLYLSLHQLQGIDQLMDIEGRLARLRQLCRYDRTNYRLVAIKKEQILWDYYRWIAPTLSRHGAFQHFMEREKDWLAPYALFKALWEHHGKPSWQEWPHEDRYPHSMDSYTDFAREKRSYFSFLQFLAFEQMEKARQVAEREGILIKGDLPILLSRESADVWWDRENFILDWEAGSPPSRRRPEGQHWGFPIYSWEGMEANDFSWWRCRLRLAERFYHLYRIDHIAGLFRIWAIAHGESPRSGRYLPGDEEEATRRGRKLLRRLIEASPLLPIGEDLGVFPHSLRPIMAEYGVCGTKVTRWERESLAHFPFLSLATPSNHDVEMITGWWASSSQEVKKIAQEKGWDPRHPLPREAILNLLRETYRSGSAFRIAFLQEILALTPSLTWDNPNDERINTPGTFNCQNWTYRYRYPLEKLFASKELQQAFKEMM
ncbi:MAG: 4-alpha-glucanotransferase [Chlamydiota bacterium]|nr:4-alpha-glucanotransferase [Chlamydiota bacterium]